MLQSPLKPIRARPGSPQRQTLFRSCAAITAPITGAYLTLCSQAIALTFVSPSYPPLPKPAGLHPPPATPPSFAPVVSAPFLVTLKLIIQIPCFNEQDQLQATIADLPRRIPGIDTIEVLIIDDGSQDRTLEVARASGVHHIVRFTQNRGLAAAYMAGLDASIRLGADLIVHTDADNQYRGQDIPALVAPILSGHADLVVGDRQTDQIPHFSAAKRLLQRLGSRIVRRFSGTAVADSTSGFRALHRDAAMRLFVHNRFTYTLESIIWAGHAGLELKNVVVGTNDKTRESRLFSSVPEYLRRNGAVILRTWGMYSPFRSFGWMALLLLLFGVTLGGRFLYFYIQEPQVSAHIQSLQVGVGSIVLAFIVALMALLSDLLAANRRLQEEILYRVRRLDAAQARNQSARGEALDGIESTRRPSWASASHPPSSKTPSPSPTTPSPPAEDNTP